jgi:hypothetical protein
MSLSRILSDKEEEILARERRALAHCRLSLERVSIEERDASRESSTRERARS